MPSLSSGDDKKDASYAGNCIRLAQAVASIPKELLVKPARTISKSICKSG
jgi:hypothetical protein